MPLAATAIANAVGQHLHRAHVTDDVETIPDPVLGYFDDVGATANDTEDIFLNGRHYREDVVGIDRDEVVITRVRTR